MTPPGRSPQRLGEMLVKRGLLSAGQVEEALAEQRTSREFLGVIVVRRGWVQPRALLGVLSEQFGLRAETIDLARVEWEVAKQFPASVLSEGRCFPIRADGESVTVAIANPLDAWTLSSIEKAVGFRKMQPVLVTPEDLQRLLQHHRQQSLRAIEDLLKDGGN